MRRIWVAIIGGSFVAALAGCDVLDGGAARTSSRAADHVPGPRVQYEASRRDARCSVTHPPLLSQPIERRERCSTRHSGARDYGSALQAWAAGDSASWVWEPESQRMKRFR